MGDIVTQRNIGGFINGLTSIFPVSSAAGTVPGVAIDRQAHNLPLSATLHVGLGLVTGSPTTTSVTVTLQDSADNSSWAAYQPDGANNATLAALTAATTEGELDIDLSLARRYIRASAVVAFTGGTSPAVSHYAVVTLGGESSQPAI